MFRFTPLALTLALITGCSAVDRVRYGEESKDPKPTEEMVAVGNHYTKAGANEIATEQAEKVCKHWRSVPAVTSVNIEKVDNYQATIKYKCY